jgi:hypothetical protein
MYSMSISMVIVSMDQDPSFHNKMTAAHKYVVARKKKLYKMGILLYEEMFHINT